MTRHGTWVGLLLSCSVLSLRTASAADLKILPGDVTLTGPHASQRLLVAAEEAGAVVGDRTGQAAFASADPAVAVVDGGAVRPVGDGETTITATVDGQQATAKVKVVRAKEQIDWSFRNHVIPMMTKVGCNSGACHGALAGKGGQKLSLRGYNPEADYFVLTRQALGRRVNLIEPNKSLVLLKPALAVPHGGGQKLEVGSPDYQLLADWIAAGAPGPKADDPAIQRLEVLPAAAVLKPKDTLQVLVRAWYSDGHSEDVTRWAKFNSSEDLVASVNADGKATVAGYGEAAVTIWYSNLVAANRITSPLPNAIDPTTFTSAPRNNFIDDLVLKKLESLHIPPSPACDDAEFIRRAYLDAAGVLPTPDEVKKFLADPAPDRRAKLIDALLERPEYVDYWAHKWSDLLVISTRRLPQQGVWAFYEDVRKSVADDEPWDRFARRIVTAQGGTLDDGAANYFVIHKDISDLTESTAVTFMGMSVTCCRCHNHPLEKWTQDQYWSFANLFSRVGLKNGDRPGEVFVQSLPEGEALHLRRGVAMPPTPLDGKPLAFDSPIDRRQYFADWLTAPDNPYFAKALVNRVWRNFMGRGLVEAEDDLRQTNPPTNPELLDALAKDFIEHKYDVKYLVRLVMSSAAYQRSSKTVAGNESDDRFYSHYLVRRLPAEVILDAYSQVTESPTPFTKLDSAAGDSTTDYGGYPLGTRAQQLPDSLVASRFLEAFGRPERVAVCSCERQQDSSVSQALHVNNGQTLNDKLRDPKGRVAAWIKDNVSDDDAVRRLYLLALSREPTAAEAKKFHDLLAESAADGKTTRQEALEDLFWAVLASKEFVFNH
jgi:hypothetical protein